MKAVFESIIIFIMILFISACTTLQSQTEFQSLGKLMPREAIVLLSNLEDAQHFDDRDIDECLGFPMRQAHPELLFISAKKFRENLYPYFMPSTTPRSLDGYKSIFEKAEVQQRIDALGVRYLVMMVKSGTITDWHGGILCGAGYGGGGCLGLSWWDRKSDFGLVIWDLRDRQRVGKIEAKAAGTGIMPAFGLPIPLYTPATETAVCKDIGRRLANCLTDRER